MTTKTLAAAGQGSNAIVQVIQSIGTTGQILGGALAVAAMVIAGVLVMTGAFSGGMRKGLAAVVGVLVGCLIIGGGAAIAPMVVTTGHDVTNQQSGTPQNGSVN